MEIVDHKFFPKKQKDATHDTLHVPEDSTRKAKKEHKGTVNIILSYEPTTDKFYLALLLTIQVFLLQSLKVLLEMLLET